MRHHRCKPIALLAAFACVVGTLWFAAPAHAQTTMRVGVVVDLGNGTIKKIPVTLPGTEAKGVDVLRAAGLDPILAGFGGLGSGVCALRVDSVKIGCEASNCLTCAAPAFWSYWRAGPGATGYSFSNVGASSAIVRDGHVEAWLWKLAPSTPPPAFVPFSEFFPAAPPPTNPPPTNPPATTPPATTPPVVVGGTGTPSNAAPPPPARTSGAPTPQLNAPTSMPVTDSSVAAPTTNEPGEIGNVDEDADVGEVDEVESFDAEAAAAAGLPVVEDDDGASAASLAIVALVVLALGGAALTIHLRRRRAQPG